LKAFSLVEDAIIGSGCIVGPYARIRPASSIGDKCQVGNFVEVKSSTIGAGSRINHHSFIGDAVLGDRVTIGAGTITCNHDGTKTNHTVIGQDAYIGSGCKLVAPLRVGGAATIGAGSTITEDVPAGTLTLARSRQVTIPHWRGPRSTRQEQ
jgi:bifunctional UDP-N-acetylglucosamine pyrophosphorylase/glucosamine-1-phosphate N-acetyltransferase